MNIDVIVLLIVLLLVVLLLIETPVAFALAAAGTVGILLLRDSDTALAAMGQAPFTAVANYSLVIIPMYIALGMFALHGKLAERVYALAGGVLKRVPGGMGIATVAACTGFSAVSGSSIATAASLGKLSVREMTKTGYRPSFATGIVAVAGSIGILIPPSIALVIYGVLSRESISQLLVAGVIPGILTATAYGVFIALRARKLVTDPENDLQGQLTLVASKAGQGHADDSIAPTSSSHRQARPPSTGTPDRISMFQKVRSVIWLAIIVTIILVGLLSGYFTVIEAAAIGALVALVMMFIENHRLHLKEIMRATKDAFLEAASVTSMVFGLLVGAALFSSFLVLARVPMRFAEWVVSIQVPPAAILIFILAALIPLGMFLDPIAVLIIVVPLAHPAVTALGYDGIWFAVLFVMVLEIGLFTPPVGINTFVVSMTSGVDIEDVFRGIFPFIFVALAMVALVFLFPDLSLWLPSLMAD